MWVAAAIAVVTGAFYFAPKIVPQTVGDFPGGVVPSVLMTGSTAVGISGNGAVYPQGTLTLAAPSGLTVGSLVDQYHGFTTYVTASGTPSTAASLGAFGSTTSSASTTVTIPESQGLTVGAICSGGAATTTVFVSGCMLTATNGVTGTAQVYYTNGTNATISVPTTTVLRITFDELPY